MSSFLRFQLYDDPSRKTFTQIGSDRLVTDPPAYGYGQTLELTDGADGTNHYVVANISRIKQETDPDRPDKQRVVYEVYLARAEEWDRFGEPDEFEQIRNGTLL